jgi:Peptidase A4 family
MSGSAIRKRQTPPRVTLHLEELECRALPSSVQPAVFETAFSTNWSGYAAETNLTTPASNAVTMVSGSWTVPTVTGKTNAYSSVWVGIDGYSSPSVEQLGTEQDTTKSGATRYYAWWEMYPNPSVVISSMTISPGDSISASVTYNSGAYTLKIKDNTTGQSFSTTQSATAQRSSAEWIVEAPSSFSGILPLANFGTANLSAAQATINGVTSAIDDASWQNTSIDMVSRSGTVIAHTSALTDTGNASGFSVTFTGSSSGGGHGHGHGRLQTFAMTAAAPFEFVPPAAAEGTTPVTANPQAPSVGQSLMVSVPAATSSSPGISQVHEVGSISGLRSWWETSQSEITNEALTLDILGTDEST